MAFSLLCEYPLIYLSILPGLGLLQRGIFRHEAILKEEYVGVRGGGTEMGCEVCHLKPTLFYLVQIRDFCL